MNTDSIYFIKTESQSIQIRFTSVVCCNELLVQACNSSHITCMRKADLQAINYPDPAWSHMLWQA